MEQRDLLKDQIEQLGKVLAKIIGDFLGLKNKVDGFSRIEISNQKLEDELDIDIDTILSFTEEELKEYFTNNSLLVPHLDELARYFYEAGKSLATDNSSESKIWLNKSIQLLSLANELSGTFSFERNDRIAMIQSTIESL